MRIRNLTAITAAVSAASMTMAPGVAFAAGERLSTGMSGALAPDVLIQSTLRPLGGAQGALIALAIAAGVLAILLAVIRGSVLNSDSSTAATVSRVVRVLAFVALVTGMMPLISFVYQDLGGGLSIAGVIELMGGA